jgi:hypothetical protein
MIVPKNVLRFEVLFYISILLNLLSYAFLDPEQPADPMWIKLANVLLCGAIGVLVYVAGRKRKSWARWALLAEESLSGLGLVNIHSLDEPILVWAGDFSSAVIAVVGLYFSFTGDARGWFNA